MLRLSARLCSCLIALALALAALPVAAEVYHVKLHNGSVVDTAYQPVQCTWDPSMVLVMTDVGNWVGLSQKDVDSVETETQVRGFGVRVNTSTIDLGWAPNDNPDPATMQTNAPSAADQAILRMAQEEAKRSHYTVQQGVSSEQSQGIPAGLTGYGGGAPPSLPLYRAPSTPVAAPSPTMTTTPAATAAPPGPGL